MEIGGESDLDHAPRVSAEQLKAWFDAGENAFIMDVRRHPDEEQIPGSRPVDPVHLLETFNPKIEAAKDQLIAIYCA